MLSYVANHIHDNVCTYPHMGSTCCTVFIVCNMNEIPPAPSIQSFSFIFSSNLVHMVSHNLRLWHTQPCLLCISPPPMRAFGVSQELLQRSPDWLLFLGPFGRRRRLEYLVLPLFTHIEEQAVTEWMESGGTRECGFSALHPRIPQSSHSHAFTLLFFHGPRNRFLFACVQLVLIKASTALTRGLSDGFGFCKQSRSPECLCCLTGSAGWRPESSALSLSFIFAPMLDFALKCQRRIISSPCRGCSFR